MLYKIPEPKARVYVKSNTLEVQCTAPVSAATVASNIDYLIANSKKFGLKIDTMPDPLAINGSFAHASATDQTGYTFDIISDGNSILVTGSQPHFWGETLEHIFYAYLKMHKIDDISFFHQQ